MNNTVVNSNNVEFFQRFIFVLILSFGVLALFGYFEPLMAAGENPLDVARQIAKKQSEEQIMPMLIMWIIFFAVIASFMAKSLYPSLIGGICILIMAVGFDVLSDWASFDFVSDATT